MFDEFENIYPQKPEILGEDVKNKAQKSLFLMVLMIGVVLFMMQDNIFMLLSLIGVVLIHELGHFIGMIIFKFKDHKVFFLPVFSPFLKQKKDTVSQKQYLIMLLLGALPGIIIGTVLLYLFFEQKNEFYLEIASLFIVVNVFTLIPVDLLDGGKIIEHVFFPSNQKVKMYFVLISSILIIFVGFFNQFYVLMLIGFLMALKVRSIQKNESIYNELEEQDIDYKKTYKSLTNKEYWKIRSVFLEFNPRLKEMIPNGDMLWENEKLLTDQITMILRQDIKEDASVFFKVAIFAVIGLVLYFPISILTSHMDFLIQFVENGGF